MHLEDERELAILLINFNQTLYQGQVILDKSIEDLQRYRNVLTRMECTMKEVFAKINTKGPVNETKTPSESSVPQRGQETAN